MKNFLRNNKEFIFEIMIIILISFFCFSLAPVTLQNDTYYTIPIGNLILKNGIDMKDHFSWHEDLPYTYPHWGYDVIMAVIYNLGGWKAIYISVCLMAMVLGITIYLVNKNLSKNMLTSLIISLGVMYLLKDYIAARAQLVTFWVFMVLIYLIEKFIENPKKIIYPLSIIALSILVANIHVAVWPFIFVLSLPYIAEYFICIWADCIIYNKWGIFVNKISKAINKKDKDKQQILDQRLQKIYAHNEKVKQARENSEPYKIKMKRNNNVKWLIVLMVICALTGFLTPLKSTPFTYLYKTMQGNTTQNINEHLPLTLINNVPIMCTIVIFIASLTFTKVKIRLADLFMLGGLCYLMFLSKRQSTIFVLIGSIILNRLLTQMLELYTKYKKEEKTKKFINVLSLIIAICVIIPFGLKLTKDKIKDSFVNQKTYPVKAAKWIKENLNVEEIKLYNEYNYGSYLLFEGIPVFIDSRADLYSPEFNGRKDDIFMDFINTSHLGKFYGSTFKKYNITHCILYRNSKISMLIDKTDSENYNKIYWDDSFVIYEIKGEKSN